MHQTSIAKVSAGREFFRKFNIRRTHTCFEATLDSTTALHLGARGSIHRASNSFVLVSLIKLNFCHFWPFLEYKLKFFKNFDDKKMQQWDIQTLTWITIKIAMINSYPKDQGIQFTQGGHNSAPPGALRAKMEN